MILPKVVLMLTLIGISSLMSGEIAWATRTAHPAPIDSAFQVVEQPTWLKTTVTGTGLVLIGLELWWFLSYRKKS